MTTEPFAGSTLDTELDRALALWATTDPAGAGDRDALARILSHADTVTTPARSRLPFWFAGGALAASVAVALLLVPNPGSEPDPSEDSPVILADASTDSVAAFELLYTPTTEEEYQL